MSQIAKMWGIIAAVVTGGMAIAVFYVAPLADARLALN
jgi:hypothetical protein